MATPTVIRAERDSSYYTRFLLMGLGALAFFGWCMYDGIYKWPLEKEQYELYESLVEQGRGGEWEQVATERGWSTEAPEHERTDAGIMGQFVMGAGVLAIALATLTMVVRSRGRWMEADGSRITTSWGETVPYAAVNEIDKKKWAKKGIAYVSYNSGGGAKKFVIDDFKFLRKPTDEILYQLEQAVGVDKIVDGDPEPDPSALADRADVEGEAADPVRTDG